MKIYILSGLLMVSLASVAQGPVTDANKCYEEKSYQCAVDNYKKAISEKAYQEKDYATILYRIGYSLGELKKTEEGIKYLKDAITVRADFGAAYWALAGAYLGLEKYDLGIENYNKAIESYKTDNTSLKGLYYWRGRCYSNTKKYTEALADFKRSINIDSTVGSYHASAGDMSYNLGIYTDAVRYYQKSIQLGDNNSKNTMAARYYWLGEAYMKLKKYDDGLTAFRGCLEYDPKYKEAHWGIGAAHYNLEKWEDARAAYNNTMSYYKDDTASMKYLYYYRGRCYSGARDYIKALGDFETALKIDPKYRGAQWQKAYMLYHQKKYSEAIPAYNLAIEMYRDEKADLDDLTYYRGYCYLQLKDTARARTDFLQALVYNSALNDPKVYMGHLSYAAGKYYEAKDYYSKAMPAFKTDTVHLSLIYFRKGFSNYILGNTYQYIAKEDFRKSIHYDSLNKEAHRYIADVYYRESNFGMAEMELDKCIRLYKSVKDSLPKMYLYRGMARSQQSKYKETLADYEQSDKLKKFTEAENVKVMGQLAFEIKDYQKAITVFTRLIPMYKPEHKNELIYAYYGRGRSSLELKKKSPAVADIKKALELAPGNKEIEGWLAKAEAL